MDRNINKINETPLMESKKLSASILMENDYLNTYIPYVEQFFNKEIIKVTGEMNIDDIKKISKSFNLIKKFLETCTRQSITISPEEEIKISKLDELADEANNLFENPTFDKKAFLKIAISAAEICNNKRIIENFKGYISTLDE
jgi:hypothetical protein